MRIIESHFHWWPRSVMEALTKRSGYPRMVEEKKDCFTLLREEAGGADYIMTTWPEWHHLDELLEHMDSLGHQVDVVASVGPFSDIFSLLPEEEGRDLAILWNEEMAGAQRQYSGRLWASAAVPIVDTQIAIDVLDHGINDLGLMGVNVPCSIGTDSRIDAERLEPFYNRVEQLGVPIFLHPTDAVFSYIMDGYNGALFRSLGRVTEVSVAAMRLVFSGIMERHPNLKVVMSHTGGALPYQSGRMDKNGTAAKLPELPSTYMKRMYTDTVSPHSAGIEFAIKYYGVDHVMYGSDYPCWSTELALKYLEEIGLSDADRQKVMYDNARRILNLKDPVQKVASAAE